MKNVIQVFEKEIQWFFRLSRLNKLRLIYAVFSVIAAVSVTENSPLWGVFTLWVNVITAVVVARKLPLKELLNDEE